MSQNPVKIRDLINDITLDPEHKLPESITAVIKHAALHNGFISGTIWYDRHDRFIDGFGVNTTKVKSQEPDGVYVTQSGNRYLVDFVTDEDYEVAING